MAYSELADFVQCQMVLAACKKRKAKLFFKFLHGARYGGLRRMQLLRCRRQRAAVGESDELGEHRHFDHVAPPDFDVHVSLCARRITDVVIGIVHDSIKAVNF